MPVDLLPLGGNLLAQATKEIVGDRLIDMFATYKKDSYKQGRKERVKNFRKFMNDAVIDIIWSNMGQITMSAANTLYTFDWNKSDAQIQQQIEANNAAITGSLGGLAANYIGRSAGIGIMGSVAMKYPKINLDMLADAKEDNLDEIKTSIQGSILAMRSSLMSTGMISLYGSGRQLLQMAGLVEPGNKPWILSEKLDEIVEQEKNPLIKSAMNRFKDELEDAVFDNIALIGNTLSASYVLNYKANQSTQGIAKVVSYTPDKEEPNNKIFCYGNEANIINAIESARISDGFMQNKDVGQIAAIAIDKALKADRNEKIVTIHYRNGINGASVKPDGKQSDKKEITLSNCKTTLSVKDLLPVLKNFQGGSFTVTAKLSDGHVAVINALSEAEGKSVLRPLVEKFCKGEIVDWSVSQPSDNVNKRLPEGLFVPCYCRFTQHRDRAAKTDKTRVYADGKFYETKTTRVNLRKPISDEIDQQTKFPWVQVDG
jgi:hypothetical protein